MRSRKPETRATMSTRRELSIWATKLSVFGIVAAATVVTATCGAGRSGGGASFEQPAAIAATRTARTIGIFPMGLIVLSPVGSSYGTKVQCLGEPAPATVVADVIP